MSCNFSDPLALSAHKLSIRKNRQLKKQSIAQITNKAKPAVLSSRKISTLNLSHPQQGSKILRYPPNYLPDRYLFEQNEGEGGSFCGCLSSSKRSQSEIYLSPNQLISRRQFFREDWLQCGDLK